jgi:GNAT superfamily N-acetyltransferase
MIAHEPVLLEPVRRNAATDVLVRAFADDVLYSWVCPDRGDRLRALRQHFRASVRYCLARGEAYTTPDLSGVALWLPPRNVALDVLAFFRSGCGLLWSKLALDPGSRRRMLAMVRHDTAIARRVVREPYWYLALLGVVPEMQGRGVGGELLAPRLRACDRDGLPCYLETEAPRNIRFYERRGFRVVHEDALPGGGPTMWAMLREPG